MDAKRVAGLALCQKYDLQKTTSVINSGGCYQAIFQAAIGEIGLEQTVCLIVKSADPEWCYLFRLRIAGLTEEQKEALYEVVAKSADSYWCYWFRLNITDLTKKQKEALCEAEMTKTK